MDTQKANKSPYDSDTQFFLNNPKAFAAKQAAEQVGKGPLSSVEVNVGSSPEQVAEMNEIKDVYRTQAQGGYKTNEEFLTALESTGEAGKSDADAMVKRAKITAEIALKKNELANIGAGKDVTRRREGVAASTVVDDLNDAMKIMDDWGYTSSGTLGRLTRWIAESPAGKVKTYIDSVKSNIGIDTLLKVKKEGSGMGQLPQKQLQELQRVLGPLDANADSRVLYQTMKEVKSLYTAVEDNMSPTDRKLVGLPVRKGMTWVTNPDTGRGSWFTDKKTTGDVSELQSIPDIVTVENPNTKQMETWDLTTGKMVK